jgi:aconitate hydratase
MVRGTFGNIRLRNQLAPGTEGGWTRYQPEDEQMPIYDAAVKYREAGTPLVVLAGKEYGSGSSRDWAAKGTRLLGVRVVLAESFERIHRSNLVNMGVLPLEFSEGGGVLSFGLTGSEMFDFRGIVNQLAPRGQIDVRVQRAGGEELIFPAIVRIDTPEELVAFQHGGILPYVLRQIVMSQSRPQSDKH